MGSVGEAVLIHDKYPVFLQILTNHPTHVLVPQVVPVWWQVNWNFVIMAKIINDIKAT